MLGVAVSHGSADPRALPSFPTRRSSDLLATRDSAANEISRAVRADGATTVIVDVSGVRFLDSSGISVLIQGRREAERSEEHTSELQSHVNLVCRLLLEKKNAE